MASSGERFYEAETWRIKGELLLREQEQRAAGDKQGEAGACFQRALDIAQNQEAKSLELRAAMNLSRLWQQQGKRQEAYALLVPIYNWFTEGFETADLKAAHLLLNKLSSQ